MIRRGRRAVALILTLLVLSILIVLIAELSFTTKMDLKVAANQLGDLQNTYALRSGLSYAKLFLKADLDKGADTDHLHETWARAFEPIPIGDARLTLAIEDEERKFNINSIVNKDGKIDEKAKERLGRLLKVLGSSDPSYLDRIADWLDKDSDGQFEEGARNATLRLPGELREIPGLTEVALLGNANVNPPVLGLLRYVTVSGDGKINVNTTTAEVLQALSANVTPDLAKAIVAWRDGKTETGDSNVYKTLPADLTKVSGVTEELAKEISPRLTVKSKFFTVHLLAEQTGIEKRAKALVVRDQGIVVLRVWQEDLNLRTRPEEKQ